MRGEVGLMDLLVGGSGWKIIPSCPRPSHFLLAKILLALEGAEYCIKLHSSTLNRLSRA